VGTIAVSTLSAAGTEDLPTDRVAPFMARLCPAPGFRMENLCRDRQLAGRKSPGALPCKTFSISDSASSLLQRSRSTPAPATLSEGGAMVEPLIGLAVAIGLAGYLIVTLIKPEWF